MGELTPEQRQELDELRDALQQEYETREADPTKTEAKKDIADLKPEMLKALKRAMEHGTIDQSSKVAMWGYGKLLDEGKAGTDPIRALIEGMPAPTDDDADVGHTSPEAELKAVDIPLDVLSETEPDDASDS